MSTISARLGVTSADSPIHAYLSGVGRIPVIEFGEKYGAAFDISLNSKMLTPAEQVEWLMRLAKAATDLAVQVTAAHMVEVAS